MESGVIIDFELGQQIIEINIPSAFAVTGLPHWLDSPIGLEFWGNISLLKAGLVTSRALTTVSPTYAREILTPEEGMIQLTSGRVPSWAASR